MYEPMFAAKGVTCSIFVTELKVMKAGKPDVPCKTSVEIIGLQAASTTEQERLDPIWTFAGSIGMLQLYVVAKTPTQANLRKVVAVVLIIVTN